MVLISRRRILRGAGAAAVVGALEAPTRGRTEPAEAEIKLKRGVNAYPWFSLTREYPAPRTDYPWPPFQTDRPVPTPRDLSRLHEAGFDFLRIPVDPGPFLAADGPVRRRLLGELKTAVEQALAAGLRDASRSSL